MCTWLEEDIGIGIPHGMMFLLCSGFRESQAMAFNSIGRVPVHLMQKQGPQGLCRFIAAQSPGSLKLHVAIDFIEDVNHHAAFIALNSSKVRFEIL